MKKKSMLAILLTMVMLVGCLTGCGSSRTAGSTVALAAGGTLILRVNPEISIAYDEKGIVTEIVAKNDDASVIVDACEDVVGKEAKEAVAILVKQIGEAGYFVEEIEGETRKITLEIEEGSRMPHGDFLEEIAEEVRECVKENEWNAPVELDEDEDDNDDQDDLDDVKDDDDDAKDDDDDKDDLDDDKDDDANDDLDDATDDLDDGKDDLDDDKDDDVNDNDDLDDDKDDADDNNDDLDDDDNDDQDDLDDAKDDDDDDKDDDKDDDDDRK